MADGGTPAPQPTPVIPPVVPPIPPVLLPALLHSQRSHPQNQFSQLLCLT